MTPSVCNLKMDGLLAMSTHLRRILIALVIALGVSLAIHLGLIVIVASITNESSVWVRSAETILTPAERITDWVAPGHSGVQIFYGFVISAVLYTGLLGVVFGLLATVFPRIFDPTDNPESGRRLPM
jgi:hypothetical protein